MFYNYLFILLLVCFYKEIMQEIKEYNLVLITENQNSIEKANKFALLICNELNLNKNFKISQYHKFSNSYKIEINGNFVNESSFITQSIKLTNKICSPWIIEYDEEINEIDLIFNKTEFSKYRNNNFNILKWANFKI